MRAVAAGRMADLASGFRYDAARRRSLSFQPMVETGAPRRIRVCARRRVARQFTRASLGGGVAKRLALGPMDSARDAGTRSRRQMVGVRAAGPLSVAGGSAREPWETHRAGELAAGGRSRIGKIRRDDGSDEVSAR